jgi:flavodoxin
MNVLILYASHTGNTEKIASAIYEEASKKNNAKVKRLNDVDPNSLGDFDQVFIGSPINAGKIVKEVTEFLSKLPRLPKMKLAGFITHAAPAYTKQTIDDMTQPFSNVCKANDMEYKGCFSCQGYLADLMHAAVKKMQKAGSEEWHQKVEQMTGHPNADDEADARAFAKSVLLE